VARLTIADRRERALVALADAMLRPVALRRAFRGGAAATPRRMLCLRLERIGDLLMTAPALAALKALAPTASIDLAVGSWNRDIAAALPGVDRVETLDAEWLARPSGRGSSALALARSAARWRGRRYDLALNFEPDIRSNIVLAAAGARRTVGFASGGGGPLLDRAIDYDHREHTADNALALVRAAMGALPGEPVAWSLRIPAAHRARAAELLAPFDGGPIAGIHVSGGRAVKQWPEARFREVAEHLARERNAAIVLTGTPAERAQIDIVRAALPPARVLDLSTADLLTAAAVIERLDLFVTGDTGPMHLAQAVGTPTVAIFGPSDPRRYGPRGVHDTIVRIDLPCSPCNRIRVPPARCTGHTPDCLEGIGAAQAIAAIDDALRHAPRRRATT
jgi:ADP-heptose:LPS heptosyltransferase